MYYRQFKVHFRSLNTLEVMMEGGGGGGGVFISFDLSAHLRYTYFRQFVNSSSQLFCFSVFPLLVGIVELVSLLIKVTPHSAHAQKAGQVKHAQ